MTEEKTAPEATTPSPPLENDEKATLEADLGDKPPQMDSREKMKKNITVPRGIALVVGTIIGTGIFITPNSITRSVGAPATSILVWLAGGAIAACGGMTFCELGSMIPRSGCEVTYLREIYGPVVGFLAIWLLHFFLGGMRRAIGVLSFSTYFWSLFYEGGESGETVNWWLDKGVCLFFLLLIAALTAFKPTLLLKVITLFTSTKILAMATVIVCGVVWLAKGTTENIAVGFNNTNDDVRDWADAWNGVIWSYFGWEQICIVTSEVQNPQRNVPIIVISSLTIVTVLYILSIISYHVVLPLEVIVQKIPIASRFGLVTMGTAGKVVLALFVVCSSLGNLMCTFLTESRYIHSGAAEGLLPGPLELVSKRFKTPLVSVIYLAGNCAVFVLIGNIDDLIGSASFTVFPFYVLCSAGVLFMRYKAPHIHRSYRVPLVFPIIFIGFGMFVFVNQFLGDAWLSSLIWVLILLCGVPIYYLVIQDVTGVVGAPLKRASAAVKGILAERLDCD